MMFRNFKIKFNNNKVNLFLDLALVVAFAVELEMHFTGLRLHELLGLAFGAALVIHIVLHWRWILAITRCFFQKLIHESRLNYVLNIGVFASMLVATVTGILISRTLSLNLGLDGATAMNAYRLHTLSSEMTLVFVGLHVAMHWKWIVTHTEKYLFNFAFLNRKAQSKTVSAFRNAEAK